MMDLDEDSMGAHVDEIESRDEGFEWSEKERPQARKVEPVFTRKGRQAPVLDLGREGLFFSKLDDPTTFDPSGEVGILNVSPLRGDDIVDHLKSVPILLPDVPHHVYHADPWGPSLSQSTATTLLSCPVKAWAAHPRLGAKAKAPTKGMERGSLVHELILSRGAGIEIIDAEDFRTNAAKEARDAARAAGKVPALKEGVAAAKKAYDELSQQLPSGFHDSRSMHEVSILWKEGKALCRCRIDALELHEGRAFIWDLKVPEKGDGAASPAKFQRNLRSNGHDLQAAVYIRAVEQVYPHLAGRVQFGFVVVELDPVPLVQVISLGKAGLSMGLRRWKRALKIWEECLVTNRWPGYAPGPVVVEPTAWQETEDAEQAYSLQGDPTAGWGEDEPAEGGGE